MLTIIIFIIIVLKQLQLQMTFYFNKLKNKISIFQPFFLYLSLLFHITIIKYISYFLLVVIIYYPLSLVIFVLFSKVWICKHNRTISISDWWFISSCCKISLLLKKKYEENTDLKSNKENQIKILIKHERKLVTEYEIKKRFSNFYLFSFA